MELDKCFFGSVTVGERGQVVIPIEARNELNMQPGDRLVIMKHPHYEGLLVAKLDGMRVFLNDLAASLDRVDVEGGAE
ncbi:MAG TPA: AbrB/MazE/SpoVT family DNA-binding domain-containing protein [Fimbriimonadaceae bacterium]|nr:AbrB/MazE/SpoVT family DNA-binding domain-containing protein [Fimbriimonadaceae bacterium]HRJ32250.1 AbrB/MazE/SpoVT family DNA-binding domain-containing protein [Fimbriimonadaceae bacterium]